jgi:nicotinamide phosphoribosyltransferase
LWDTFGGVVRDDGLRQLDSHIGAIYGDSITLERQDQIINKLEAKGFVPSVVLGIGSFSYQMCSRDTHGSAVKATDIQFGTGNHQPIFKDPKTDQKKKSAKGLLRVDLVNGEYVLTDDVTPEREGGELQVVFLDGQLVNPTTLNDIRARIDSNFI